MGIYALFGRQLEVIMSRLFLAFFFPLTRSGVFDLRLLLEHSALYAVRCGFAALALFFLGALLSPISLLLSSALLWCACIGGALSGLFCGLSRGGR